MLKVLRRVLIVLLWLAVPLQGALAQAAFCGPTDLAGHAGVRATQVDQDLHADHAGHANHAGHDHHATDDAADAPSGDPHGTAGCAHCAGCCAAAALAPPVPGVLLLDVDGSPVVAPTVRPHGTVPARLERPPRTSRA